MEATVTLPLADYTIMKDDIKKLSKAATDKSVVLRITKGVAGNQYYQEYHVLELSDAFVEMKENFQRLEVDYQHRRSELLQRINDLEARNNSLNSEMATLRAYYATNKKKKWWQKIF